MYKRQLLECVAVLAALEALQGQKNPRQRTGVAGLDQVPRQHEGLIGVARSHGCLLYTSTYQSMNKIKIDGKPSEDVLVHMLATEMQINTPSSGD